MSQRQNDSPLPARTTGVDQDADGFQTTHWSLVLDAGHRSTIVSQQALAELCQIYWWPLYAYVRRRVGDQHRAQDLTQAFFARLLEKDFLRDADPLLGKFRAFLLTAFKRFMANEWHKETAQKRGGVAPTVSLDFSEGERQYNREPADTITPEQMFLRNWARTLLNRVLHQLKAEYVADGKIEAFDELQGFITPLHDTITAAGVAERLGISENAVRVAAHRLRKRYRRLLRREIARTVSGRDEIEEEIHSLFDAFSGQ